MRTLSVKDLSKSFKGVTIFQHLSFDVTSGTILGIAGPNGSGKSVLFKIIAGLMRASSGHVTIDNVQVGKEIEHPHNMGILIEKPEFVDAFTGFENLKFLGSLNGKVSDDTIQHLLMKFKLGHVPKLKYKRYSLGMKQRLGLVQAIMEDQTLLLLDEPINALDEASVSLVKELLVELKQKGCIILLTSHDRDFLHEMSDTIIDISKYGGE